MNPTHFHGYTLGESRSLQQYETHCGVRFHAFHISSRALWGGFDKRLFCPTEEDLREVLSVFSSRATATTKSDSSGWPTS